jgi:c-di-GMP-binding flagellar brake protein YcgR
MKVEDLRINQLIEVEMDNDDSSEYLPSRIEEIKDKYLYISMPMRKGNLLPLSQGQEIKIIIRHKNSTFGFISKVAARRREPIPYLIINKPESLMPVNQKREFVRLNITLPVRFRVIVEEGEEGPEQIEEGVTIDISAGGILFYTQAQLQTDGKLEIELQLSRDESLICRGHVIRLLKPDEHDKNAIRIAIEYDDITEAQRDRIFRFIFEKQRDWIKKGIL